MAALDRMATRPWILDRAERTPDAPALVTSEASASFAELATESEGVARALTSMGLGRGDRVALLAAADRRFVAIVHALQWIGAACVPLSSRMKPPELASQLDCARPALLLHDRAHARAAEDAIHASTAGAVMRRADTRGELDAASAAKADVPSTTRPEDVHSLLFTSGTTSAPKAVVLTNANHLASVRASAERLGSTGEDRWLAVLPLHHVGGLGIVLRSVVQGFAVELHERFDPNAANRSIREHGTTFVSLVATMLARMLDDGGDERYPDSLRCALVGGAALPAPILERALDRGVPVYVTYGLTETASQVTAARVFSKQPERGFAGSAMAGIELRIDAPSREEPGEVLVRGPQVTAGYFDDVQATRARLDDGWLHTGDVGRIDAAGDLHVLGRLDDMIVTGGENVQPAEVEEVLLAHPDVAEAGVRGCEDPEWGQRVVAWVVPREGRGWDADALRAWCAQRLAGFKVPRELRRVVSLPRTASGKLQRRLLD